MRNITKTNIDFQKVLSDPHFIRSVVADLLSNFKHEIVQKPRLFFESSPRGKKLVKNKTKLKEHSIKVKLPPDPDSFDFDDEDFGDDDEAFNEPKTYYRRDSFLTGGAVAAVICEKLLNIPKVINDIDIFYYRFKSKEQSGAEAERYNNLQGEDKSYHIAKVKEVGLLNFVEINIEDNFSWAKVLESFDLNYSQVGIVLAENKLIFTEEFIDFLTSKVIKLSADYDDDFPLTSYVRAAHKAIDFKTKFYDKEVVKEYLVNYHGEEIFKNETDQFEITHDRDEADNTEIVLVTEKRFEYWLKNPTILPYLQPVMEEDKKVLKIKLPQEPWVEVCRSVFSNQEKNGYSHYTTDIIRELISAIPNFYDLRPTVAFRLKNLINSKIVNLQINNKSPLAKLIAKHPRILKEDFSLKKLEQVSDFLKSHLLYLNRINEALIYRGFSVNQVLDFLLGLKKIDLNYLGILETFEHLPSVIKNDENSITLQPNAKVLEMAQFIVNLDFKGLEKSLEEIHLKQLEKNLLIPRDQILSIKPFGRWVTEITRLDQLQAEGKNMNHCVGGYSAKIKEGRSRIFHICVNGNHSTLEVGLKEEDYIHYQSKKRTPQQAEKYPRITKNKVKKITYTNNQHRARFNNNPHKSNHLVAELLLKYLNNFSGIKPQLSPQAMEVMARVFNENVR